MDSLIDNLKTAFDNNPTFETIEFIGPVLDAHAGIGSESNISDNIPPKNEYVRDLVYREERFEIFLITWAPRAESKIHNHAPQGCVMKLLSGALLETKFDSVSLGTIGSTVHTTCTKTSFIDNNIALHSICNQSTDSYTLSLHVYSPPNYISQTFI